jgi:anhydro-N-acetylmuramic acid kinase
LTARSIAGALARSRLQVEEVYICGGGAHNPHLLHCLDTAMPDVSIATTAELGVDPDWVEAAAFAWLAYRRIQGLHANAPVVTGARGERILGGVYLP